MFEQSKLFAESWNVAWRKKKKGAILDDVNTPFHVVENTMRYWAADPFLFVHQGMTYIFAELYDYVRCRGIIGYCTIEGETTTQWKPAIVEDHHLSFPFIFQKAQDIYIMPESSAGNALCVYRAVNFPDEWERTDIIRENVKYADTTAFMVDGHPYALTYEIHDPANQVLMLLDLDHPERDKVLNLDHMELRRPAGRLMEKNQIRSAQNCTGGYGKGLIFYQYTIDHGDYKEKEIKRIFPYDLTLSRRLYLDGMHTYNFDECYEVIDIKTRRFNMINFAMRLIHKLK